MPGTFRSKPSCAARRAASSKLVLKPWMKTSTLRSAASRPARKLRTSRVKASSLSTVAGSTVMRSSTCVSSRFHSGEPSSPGRCDEGMRTMRLPKWSWSSKSLPKPCSGCDALSGLRLVPNQTG